jgi:PTH1 family peptidyl-tRNA hydrolase
LKLIVGLGNPGEKYRLTRHNVGFMLAERLAAQADISLKKKGYLGLYGTGRIAQQQLTILLPQTFMNLSGTSVKAAYQALGISPGDLIVIHDDLDLPFGTLRIKTGGGHGGHNGIRNICALLGCSDFHRVRMGIGRPEHEQADITQHVLSSYTREQQPVLNEQLDRAVAAVHEILATGVQAAMNIYNRSALS